MARPCKPLELLELSGTYRADRHAWHHAAPKSPHPIGDPSPCVAEDESRCWREFVSNAPAGVLTSGERVILEATARLVARSRRQGLTSGETGALRRLLGELGASPASRGRVLPAGPAEPAGGNPWDVRPFERPVERLAERPDKPWLFCATQGRTTTRSNARLTGTAIRPDHRRPWPNDG